MYMGSHVGYGSNSPLIPVAILESKYELSNSVFPTELMSVSIVDDCCATCESVESMLLDDDVEYPEASSELLASMSYESKRPNILSCSPVGLLMLFFEEPFGRL